MANTKDVSKEELLQLLEEQGIISSDAVQELIYMDKRSKILEQHKYPITKGSNLRWYTYLPDATRNAGRKQIAKSTKEKVEDAVVEFYLALYEEDKITYKVMFERWVKVKEATVVQNTITRYYNDYDRCIKGTELEDMEIQNINEEILVVFLANAIKDNGLTYRALTNLVGNLSGVFKSAKINKIITENPCDYIDISVFRQKCKLSTKTDAEKIVSDDELEKIFQVIDAKLTKRPKSMTLYAILLASLTGMRVGELSALAWDDISDTCIRVWQSEKRIVTRGKKAVYVIEPFTKTGKERKLPLTPEINELLNAIRKVQETMGIEAKYVFQSETGRVHSTSIVTCADTVSQKAGVSNKSIHSYRKTLSSNLRNLNCSTKTIAAMLGHTEEVNRSHYSYDTTDMDFKRGMLSKVNKNVVDLDGYKGTKDVIKSVIKREVV